MMKKMLLQVIISSHHSYFLNSTSFVVFSVSRAKARKKVPKLDATVRFPRKSWLQSNMTKNKKPIFFLNEKAKKKIRFVANDLLPIWIWNSFIVDCNKLNLIVQQLSKIEKKTLNMDRFLILYYKHSQAFELENLNIRTFFIILKFFIFNLYDCHWKTSKT